MTDDIQGECKTCGENAGGMPAAKSMAELARESWLQDVTVRPYQPTVEALAAARTGARSASEGLGLTAKAMSALSMEEHRPLEAPREFPVEPLNPTPRTQPRVEVSYLSAPWSRPHPKSRAPAPHRPMRTSGRAPTSRKTRWAQSRPTPRQRRCRVPVMVPRRWLALGGTAGCCGAGKRIAFTGGDLPSKGLLLNQKRCLTFCRKRTTPASGR